MTLVLTSSAFGQGATIPKKYTCDGENRSPPFEWSGVPEGTQVFLLVCNDPATPDRLVHHWAAYNIPGDWRRLVEGFGPESLEPGFVQAMNDFGRPGYAGPCPPKGEKPRAYHFRLSALSAPVVPAAPSATCTEIIVLARPYVIDYVELVGFYGRKK